jgi:hypothetical protein
MVEGTCDLLWHSALWCSRYLWFSLLDVFTNNFLPFIFSFYPYALSAFLSNKLLMFQFICFSFQKPLLAPQKRAISFYFPLLSPLYRIFFLCVQIYASLLFLYPISGSLVHMWSFEGNYLDTIPGPQASNGIPVVPFINATGGICGKV